MGFHDMGYSWLLPQLQWLMRWLRNPVNHKKVQHWPKKGTVLYSSTPVALIARLELHLKLEVVYKFAVVRANSLFVEL